jgi:DNA recombination protein RmuC
MGGAVPPQGVGMMQYLTLALAGASFLCAAVTLIVVLVRTSQGRGGASQQGLDALRREMVDETRASRQESSQELRGSMQSMSEVLARSQGQAAEIESRRLTELSAQLTARQQTLQATVQEMVKNVDKRLADNAVQNEIKLDGMRTTIENRLASLQEDNNKKLEQMRATVDEKLEKTLGERIGQSFKLVSERLEQVYKGLGEMQTLAVGVGDLKKVLSNVKTRGVLGEIQLGSILEQILSPEQYDANVATKHGSQAFVEYAVKLPGDDSGTVYLPIDAKFPADAYTALCDAYDTGDKAAVEQAGSSLERRIKLFAKDIHDRYLDPPNTTEFGVMFLPFEGLYSEVVRRGLLETLQRDYHVTVAGPTTMAALLNSLQMGFRTLAIQKRSGEVWKVLGAVRTEFDKFGGVLTATQQRLEQANSELDKLVGVRTRQIQRRLQGVDALPEAESAAMLGIDSGDEDGADNSSGADAESDV